MKSTILRYFIYGQLCLYVGLLGCAILRPHGLVANEGISYYGVYQRTIVAYFVALFGSAYFSFLVSVKITQPKLFKVRVALILISLFTLAVLSTPDTISTLVEHIHETCGALLFITQLLLSGWLIYKSGYNLVITGLALLELAGGIASFIWLEAVHGYLLESQVVFQLGFGLLMIYALPKLEDFTNLPKKTKIP
jgi:hypothetical protein